MAADTHVSFEEVRRIARLARLELSPQESASMARDLGEILAYIQRLDAIDTSHVQAVTHGVDPEPMRRVDVVHPSPGTEQGLQNAPDRLGDGFGVPKIIE